MSSETLFATSLSTHPSKSVKWKDVLIRSQRPTFFNTDFLKILKDIYVNSFFPFLRFKNILIHIFFHVPP